MLGRFGGPEADAACLSAGYTILMARASSARLRSLPTRDPGFIEPMECLAVSKLPDAAGWVWEIKLESRTALSSSSPATRSLSARSFRISSRRSPQCSRNSRRHRVNSQSPKLRCAEFLKVFVIADSPYIPGGSFRHTNSLPTICWASQFEIWPSSRRGHH